MCPLRNPFTITTIVLLFVAIGLLEFAEKKVKDKKMLKIVKIADWALTIGMAGYALWLVGLTRHWF